MPEDLRPGQAQRYAGFDLGLRNALQSGAHDFGGVGGQVDGQGQHARGHDIQFDTDSGQAEKDQEQLDDQRRVPDDFHVDPCDGNRPGPSVHEDDGEQGPEHETQRDRDSAQLQGNDDAIDDGILLRKNVPELEAVRHFKYEIGSSSLFSIFSLSATPIFIGGVYPARRFSRVPCCFISRIST